MTQPSVFAGLDLGTVLYAAFMATLISLIMTLRERNRQAAQQLPLTPWRTVIPDTVLGTITGTACALGLPMVWPSLHNVVAVGVLAGAGGVLGPKVWDLISTNGLQVGLQAIAESAAGPLAKLARAAATASAPKTGAGGQEGDDDAGTKE